MLKLENINKSYTTGTFTQQALKNVNLEFRKNEFVAVLGPSGSGKTTLLNIIGGLDRYDNGDLIINEKSTKKFKSHEWDAYRNNCIGFVFQSYNLITHLSLVENVEMGMTLSGVGARKRRKKALELLDKVGLKEHSHKKPNQLSGGQMQRVAIARALANDPDVILADEPTGALDSTTSVQILELIQEIAKDKLVIMVTHNGELANKYATRVVSFKDGELINDTMPITKDEKKGKPWIIRKTAMNMLTALKLSFNNIITKKGRTLLTAFASSIGIIGIALILSLSNGFQIQIDKIEHETLSNFPIMISKTTMDLSEDTMIEMHNDQQNKENEYPKESYVFPHSNEFRQIRHENIITDEYLDYINKLDKNLLSGISYTRIAALNLLAIIDGKATLINTSSRGGGIMAQMNQVFTSVPKKVNDKSDFMANNYDILYGRMPSSKEELVIQVDSRNRLDTETVKMLGLNSNKEKIAFEDLIGREFKIAFNDDFYKKFGEYYTLNQDYEEMYNNENSLTLKIVGIIRGKEGNQLTAEGNGIGYTEDLMDYVISVNSKSNISLTQTNANYNVLTGEKFDLDTKEGLETKENLLAYLGAVNTPYAISIFPADFDSKSKVTDYLDAYNDKKAEENKKYAEAYLNALIEKITSDDDELLNNVDETLVKEATIEQVTFKYKDTKLNGTIIVNNCEYRVENNIITKSSGGVKYTDLAATMISLFGSALDAITIVLIAFSAISLIVSSIMIGIITYISVLERTKEIGILRALGARKKDISRVFNAETFIIGVASGLIGIGIALILTIPANRLIYNLTEFSNVARLNPLHALLLIIVSVTLTVIGGLIPARIASKKDPVEALRTE